MITKAATESASILRSRKQVVTMLMTVVVFFFACMMPFKGIAIAHSIFSTSLHCNVLVFAALVFKLEEKQPNCVAF